MPGGGMAWGIRLERKRPACKTPQRSVSLEAGLPAKSKKPRHSTGPFITMLSKGNK